LQRICSDKVHAHAADGVDTVTVISHICTCIKRAAIILWLPT